MYELLSLLLYLSIVQTVWHRTVWNAFEDLLNLLDPFTHTHTSNMLGTAVKKNPTHAEYDFVYLFVLTIALA